MIDTKAIRRRVMELAITGLLTEAKTPETACDLIEQIAKVYKQKYSPVLPEEMPFDIPSNWSWVRIGNIFNLHAGKSKTSSQIKAEPFDNSYPCYGGNGLRGYTDEYNQEGYYCLIGRQGALCGNVNFANGRFYATEHAVVVDTFCDCNVTLIGLFLKQMNLNQYATSVAQPGLAVGVINKVPFPLPPLAEQQRIVERVESIFSLLDEIDAAQAEYNDNNEQLKSKLIELAITGHLVKQSVAFGNAADDLQKIKLELKNKETLNIPEWDIPKSWIWCKLGEVASVVTGTSYTPNDVSKGKIRIIRGGNISRNQISLASDDVFVSDSLFDKRKALTKGDTIIVASTGSTVALGKPAFVEEDADEMQIGAFLRIIRPNCGDIAEYINLIFNSSYYKAYILSTSAGVNINNIKGKALENMPIPFPPIKEQKMIVDKLNELLPLCS